MLAVCVIVGCVFNTGGKENRGVGGKKGYISSGSCDMVHILRFGSYPAIWFITCVLLVNEHKTAQPSSCTTTRHLMNEEPRDEIQYSR